MTLFRFVNKQIIAALFSAFFLAACSVTPFSNDTASLQELEQRAVTETQGGFTVRASVPSTEEARALFGIPMHKRGIQAVWLEIANNSAYRARFAPYSLDEEYFPPYEVAYMHRKRFSKQGHADLEKFLASQSIPRQIAPGETVSGFVFTHSSIGTKAFNVDIYYTGGEARNEHFTFFVNVPGFVPDHAEVNFRELYADNEVLNLSKDEFRDELKNIPCCTNNRDGTAMGRPIQAFLVARGNDLLQVLLRSGWLETSYEKSDIYLNKCNYLFGRCPDAVFKKGRDRTSERLEMAVWLTPMWVEGSPVWAVQTNHAIGRRYEIGEYFLGIRLDPHADEGRNFLLQDLWYGQSMVAFGWSRSGLSAEVDAPKTDFSGNIWFSDGFRLVAWISGDPVSMSTVQHLRWDRVLELVEEGGP